MTKAEPQMMSRRSQGSSGAVSSGHFRVRRVMNATTGSTTSSYVKGYTVTADYTGTVSRIALNRVRYVAIFEGVPIQSAEPAKTAGAMSSLRWSYVLIPIGVVAAAGAGVGGALLVKRRKENADEEETEE